MEFYTPKHLWLFICVFCTCLYHKASSATNIHHEYVYLGGTTGSIQVDPVKMGWYGSIPYYILAKENSTYIKKLMNGATAGNGICYKDIDPDLQPLCDLHFSLSMSAGHVIYTKLSGVTEVMAGKYLLYPWADVIMNHIKVVQIIIHIKDLPTTKLTIRNQGSLMQTGIYAVLSIVLLMTLFFLVLMSICVLLIIVFLMTLFFLV